jgi:N-acetylmuramoyl-L-alanine amidase
VEARSVPFHVCIDPGHPSENNDGRTLSHGLREVTVCWQVALLLRRQLEQAGVQVTLTKQQEGQFVPNRDRALLANAVGADLLLRLHADAGGGTGFTVYYPRRQGVAERTTGPSTEVLRASAAAARRFYPMFAAALKGRLRDNGLRGDEQTLIGRRQGALTGSIFSRVPTLLVEMAFLTNARDAAWIRQAPNQQRMAAALAQGVLALRAREPAPAAGGNGR